MNKLLLISALSLAPVTQALADYPIITFELDKGNTAEVKFMSGPEKGKIAQGSIVGGAVIAVPPGDYTIIMKKGTATACKLTLNQLTDGQFFTAFNTQKKGCKVEKTAPYNPLLPKKG